VGGNPAICFASTTNSYLGLEHNVLLVYLLTGHSNVRFLPIHDDDHSFLVVIILPQEFCDVSKRTIMLLLILSLEVFAKSYKRVSIR